MAEIVEANFLPEQPAGIKISGKGDVSRLHQAFKNLGNANTHTLISHGDSHIHYETDLRLLAPYGLAVAELLGEVPLKGYKDTPKALSVIALEPSICFEATIIAARPSDSYQQQRNQLLLHSAVELANQEAIRNQRPARTPSTIQLGLPLAKLSEGQTYL